MNNIFTKIKNKIDNEIVDYSPTKFDVLMFDKFCKKIGANPSRVICSIGTLGGG